MQSTRTRIGELLGTMTPLSALDIQEILNEQESNPRRFGDIAMSLGKCEPRHVWAAWVTQLEGRIEHVNLDELGVDVQALRTMPSSVARELCALPLRDIEPATLVVAFAELPSDEKLKRLETIACRRVVVVLCDPVELGRAIERYYPPLSRSA